MHNDALEQVNLEQVLSQSSEKKEENFEDLFQPDGSIQLKIKVTTSKLRIMMEISTYPQNWRDGHAHYLQRWEDPKDSLFDLHLETLGGGFNHKAIRLNSN